MRDISGGELSGSPACSVNGGIVEEEADEVSFWLDLIVGIDLINAERLNPLRQEAEEIIKIIVASICTAKKHNR